ncbi:hypothetical protein L218DRAFT_1076545 [Marasmius fiardii PR-910]|nr:hypothetical protein L218DRAFT_1076545 [Marasmius fiardii PR-910]
MAFQSSQTLLELINFLTRPLTKVYPVLTVMYHRQVLQKQLRSAFFSDATASTPFTLILSPALLPPAPIYATCLMSGVQWVEWVRLLAPQGMCVFVTEGLIKAKTAERSELTTVWSKAERSPTPSVPLSTSREEGSSRPTMSLSKLQTALKSVQSRNAAIVKPLNKPQIVVNTGIAVDGRRTSPRTPFRPQPSRLSQVITISDDEDEDEDEDDSDWESDAGSTISSSSSFFSATESESSSVTSVASSNCVFPCTTLPQPELNLDALRAAIQSRLTVRTPSNVSCVSQRPSRAQSHKVERDERRLVNPTKTNVTRYSYKGGQTAVMTGGVMLGAIRSQQRC